MVILPTREKEQKGPWSGLVTRLGSCDQAGPAPLKPPASHSLLGVPSTQA